MDPTTTKKHHHLLHPQPDPTVQNISHRFTKLYLNHKKKYTQPTPTTTTTLTLDSTKTHQDNDYKKTIITTESKPINETTVIKEQEQEEKEEEMKKKKKLVVVNCSNKSNVSRRKSFSSSSSTSQLGDFFSCAGVKVVAVDMPPFMQIHAVDCARKAHDSLENFTSKTLALTLKKEFDGVYGPAWHCIVGTSFGSFVTHSVGGFMYFSMDHKLYILLFKTTVQRALTPS